jgi:hypothetical protein
MGTEAILAAAYTVFLVATAGGLDLLARHSHRRSGQYRTLGFEFREDLDVWECPEGEYLQRLHLDETRRIVRYRARAAACNSCPVKDQCTDSDDGREIVRPLDPWPHSEAGRFHRGICVALAALGAVISALALVRAEGVAEMLALAASLGVSAVVAGRLLDSFRRTPAGFPAPPSA